MCCGPIVLPGIYLRRWLTRLARAVAVGEVWGPWENGELGGNATSIFWLWYDLRYIIDDILNIYVCIYIYILMIFAGMNSLVIHPAICLFFLIGNRLIVVRNASPPLVLANHEASRMLDGLFGVSFMTHLSNLVLLMSCEQLKRAPGCLRYIGRGLYDSIVWGYMGIITIIRIPVNQPGFNGK